MYKLRLSEMGGMSNVKKERMRQLIDRWEIAGGHKEVLLESLRALGDQSGGGMLLGIRKQVRARVRCIAFVDPKKSSPFPQMPALPEKDAQRLLGLIKEFGICRTRRFLSPALGP